MVGQVLGLYRERYHDLHVRHFHEKLTGEHQIPLRYSWVKGIVQGAGLRARGRKRGVHRQRRERRPLPGMLLHIDGSQHRWFQDQRWYDLLVILDDATSEIYYAQLVAEESTLTVMAALERCVGFWILGVAWLSCGHACGRQLYDALLALSASPVVAINRAVAVAELHGARRVLDDLRDIAADCGSPNTSPTGRHARSC